ncbi:glutamate-cysteine ligase family protein [Telmatospirillum sp. J64-1]|uniref:glutamate-cysteine ligase family protein n=1 Tax=Telmatospirillum sp. J64-1 TaxID=2502183 RepID=UPI00115D8C8C|nr:glutamate-cysteine ligase family protein [Telmatospirillum sp. J64-1]
MTKPFRQMRTSLGVEIEMALARLHDGTSHCVGPFFQALRTIKQTQGEGATLSQVEGRDIAVNSPLVCTSLDNAFNNLESAIGPVVADGAESGLHALDAMIRRELRDITAALAAEGAGILNLSQHPALAIDEDLYKAVRAPKAIYDYWVDYRGWDHKVGIDAKAQNGPTTGIGIRDAVAALNVILAASPAFIALFANSPFENGRETGYKETRLTIWPRMFAKSRFPADDQLHRLPSRPFADLRDYFAWMFGPHTHMQIIPRGGGHDYKCMREVVRVAGDPALLEFLKQPSWQATHLAHGTDLTVTPSLRHLEFLQFSQFIDARIRYGFAEEPSVEDFFAAWNSREGLEPLFERTTAYCYIEGRSPGANFPDRDLLDRQGEGAAASVTIAPSALQMGLLRNLSTARHWLEKLDWSILPALREAAIRDGMAGEAGGLRLRDLCEAVIDLAADGLAAHEHWMLAYPQRVLRDGQSGADRALAQYHSFHGSSEARLRRLCEWRQAVVVPAPAPLVAA